MCFADHQNWFGIDANLGPLAVSLRREKVPSSVSSSTCQQQQFNRVPPGGLLPVNTPTPSSSSALDPFLRTSTPGLLPDALPEVSGTPAAVYQPLSRYIRGHLVKWIIPQDLKTLLVTTLLFPAVMSTCTGSLSELRTSFLWGDVSWKSPSRPSGSRRKKSSQSRPKRSWSSCFQKFNYLGKTKTNAKWNDVSNIWASDHCNVPNEFLNWTPKFMGNKCVFRPQVWLQKQASWAAQMKC